MSAATWQKHKLYVSQHGEELPEVMNWRWSGAASGRASSSLDTRSDN